MVCRLSLDDDQLDSTEFSTPKMSSVWSCSSVSDEFCFPPPARSSLPGAKPKHCYDNAEGLPWWSIVAG